MNHTPPDTIKVGLLQRIVPSYRTAFFSLLGEALQDRFSLFAGEARRSENVHQARDIAHVERCAAKNIHILKGKTYFCWQNGLMRWLRTWNPDVLILEANPRYLHSHHAIRWMKNQNRPVIGWGLGTGGEMNLSSIVGRQWWKFFSQFDMMISYSQKGAEEFINMGFNPSMVVVAPNAVLRRPSTMTKRSPDFSEDGPIILYVGRLQERKKIDHLIQACAVVEERRKLQLWIVGDGPEKERLKRIAADILPVTRFFGALHGDDVTPLFEKADLFVLPGTGGLAVQEAMSYGLPVIVAEADGTQSNLVRPENGWMVQGEDVLQLTECLETALRSSAKLREMGRRSFSIVQNDVNLEIMVDVFLSAINTVMEKQG